MSAYTFDSVVSDALAIHNAVVLDNGAPSDAKIETPVERIIFGLYDYDVGAKKRKLNDKSGYEALLKALIPDLNTNYEGSLLESVHFTVTGKPAPKNVKVTAVEFNRLKTLYYQRYGKVDIMLDPDQMVVGIELFDRYDNTQFFCFYYAVERDVLGNRTYVVHDELTTSP